MDIIKLLDGCGPDVGKGRWRAADGPRSGCGEDYWFVNDADPELKAYANNDQGHWVVRIYQGEDDEYEVFEGQAQVRKIIRGYVTQVYDLDQGRFVSQFFTAGHASWVDSNGEPFDAEFLKDDQGRPISLAAEMVQPGADKQG